MDCYMQQHAQSHAVSTHATGGLVYNDAQCTDAAALQRHCNIACWVASTKHGYL
jgi:hypothetical protein